MERNTTNLNNQVVPASPAETTGGTQKERTGKPNSINKGTDRSSALICLVLLTAIIAVSCVEILFNSEANTSTPAIIIFILYCIFTAAMWAWYIISRTRKNKKIENLQSIKNENNPIAAYTAEVQADSTQTRQGETVELHCKVCNKALKYFRGIAKQKGMISLQSGTYCESCLSKLFEQDTSEILFIIDAEWGQYSKRIELRGGQYYYAETRVTGVINPVANLWNEDERAHEIGFDEALSYAKAITKNAVAEDVENLKIIESVRRKIRNQSNRERTFDSPNDMPLAIPESSTVPTTVTPEKTAALSNNKSTWEKIAEFGLNQDILGHIVIKGEWIRTDLSMPGGGPYMRGSGDSWSGAYSYDDMRGPQGIFNNVPFEEAFGNIAKIVDNMINSPSSEYYFYNPNKVPWKRSVVAEKDIERCAYWYRQDIVSITVKDGVNRISDCAFEYCKNLESADIGNSVTDIGSFAFGECSKLKRVRYHGTEEQWKKIEIAPGNNPLINADIMYGSE